jgi:ubiquinone biosynthesis protein UbiJ
VNREGPVWQFCEWLWKLRREGTTAVSVTKISRELALACANQVRVMEDYDPEADNKVKWARGVVAAIRRGERPAKAAPELEAAVEFMMIPSGKMLAAGGDA